MASTPQFDLFVIGGGINGTGIARDAAGRGYSVFLAEMDDLASGTSSASTKLIHGGLRYLEYYEFRLVHEALREREILWASAPHIIWPMRFVLPHHAGLRPAWFIRLGLLAYDNMGARRLLPPTTTLDMRADPAGKPLKPLFTQAFEYSDCWVNDARLVALVARDAADRGATIRTRTEVVSARQHDGLWSITVRDRLTGAEEIVSARMLVNAAGPWVARVLAGAIGANAPTKVRLVKGSHIVVPKLFEHDKCYFFQNADNRLVFVIPYEEDFTLIGTTDLDYAGDPKDVAISEEEVSYLCAAASEYFARPVTPAQVVWTYSGVRPLSDDGASKAQEATRDYVLDTSGGSDTGAPLLNIIGGKITTFRRLAEAALVKVEDMIGRKGPHWTKHASLPGGNFPAEGYEDQVASLRRDYAFLAEKHTRRLVRHYGTLARTILKDAKATSDLGRHFGSDLYEAEVNYLVEREWARTTTDILWRRTKLGLRGTAIDVAALDNWLDAKATPP